MSRAVLSLGSNLGDRAAVLDTAVAGLRTWLQACSAVYETRPWGPVAQGEYLNMVVIVEDPAATALDWWHRAQALERAAGRVRAVRFGPRTLDVDVISVDDARSADPELTLPHPRAAQRAFVLVPWLAVDADAVLPGVGPIADLVAGLDPVEAAGVRLAPAQSRLPARSAPLPQGASARPGPGAIR